MKDTDFNKVKDMAITFAYQPVEPLKIDGLGDGALFVSHPFTNSPIRPVPSKDNPSRPVLVNVLQPEGEAAFREFIVDEIKASTDLWHILAMMEHTYYFTFLDHIQSYLSDSDLGSCLRHIWKSVECANDGTILTKTQICHLFYRSTKETLMDKDELETLHSLPEKIIVYRGTTSKNSKDLMAFSWTLSLKSAEWFAKRFDDREQKIFQAEIPKSEVLAYFSHEEEIVVNPYKLEGIHLIQEFSQKEG